MDIEGNCVVEVRRHAGFLAGALKAVVSVNGKDVATLRPSQKVILSLPGGSHRFSVRWSGDHETASSVRLLLEPGQMVRLGINVDKSDSVLWRAQPSIREM